MRTGWVGWNTPRLPPGQFYNGPTAEKQNKCICSSVVYNLLGACTGVLVHPLIACLLCALLTPSMVSLSGLHTDSNVCPARR